VDDLGEAVPRQIVKSSIRIQPFTAAPIAEALK
jgi:hypothetical protein